MPVPIVIADDHAVVHQGLRMFLGLDPELAVVGGAQAGQEALTLARAPGGADGGPGPAYPILSKEPVPSWIQ